MVRVSKLADYATVIMHWLSRQDGDCVSASVISEQLGFATPTVSKILKLLHDAGLVDSKRGSNGGYQLSRPADQVTLADLITAIDGRPAVTECSRVHGSCRYYKSCELSANWQYINKIIYNILNQLTLHDMHASLAELEVSPLHFYSFNSERETYVGN